jgi:hypothetical protein
MICSKLTLAAMLLPSRSVARLRSRDSRLKAQQIRHRVKTGYAKLRSLASSFGTRRRTLGGCLPLSCRASSSQASATSQFLKIRDGKLRRHCIWRIKCCYHRDFDSQHLDSNKIKGLILHWCKHTDEDVQPALDHDKPGRTMHQERTRALDQSYIAMHRRQHSLRVIGRRLVI